MSNLIQIKTNSGWQDLVALRGKQGSVITKTEKTGTDPNGGYIYTQTYEDGKTATFTAPMGPSSSYFVSVSIPTSSWTALSSGGGYQATFTAFGYDDDTMAGFPMPVASSTSEWRRCQIVASGVSGTTVTLQCVSQPSITIDLVFNVTTFKKTS